MSDRDHRTAPARPRVQGDAGATYAEYAVLVLVIAVVCVAAVVILGRTA